jgi:hypothetical protein
MADSPLDYTQAAVRSRYSAADTVPFLLKQFGVQPSKAEQAI